MKDRLFDLRPHTESGSIWTSWVVYRFTIWIKGKPWNVRQNKKQKVPLLLVKGLSVLAKANMLLLN